MAQGADSNARDIWTAGDPIAADDEWLHPLAWILRGILAIAFAAAVAGVLVAGIGGRVVMRVAALLNPQAIGATTENGNVVGHITIGGTFALALFGGLISGLIGSVVFVAIGRWLPERGLRRAVAAGVSAVALGGTFVVDADNPDFLLLGADAAVIAMLLGVVGAFGLATAVLAERFMGRLPRPGANPRTYVLPAGALVLLGGFLFLPAALAVYLGPAMCLCGESGQPGIALAVPLLIAGVATCAAWGQELTRRAATSSVVVWTGRLATLAAVAIGTGILAGDISSILS